MVLEKNDFEIVLFFKNDFKIEFQKNDFKIVFLKNDFGIVFNKNDFIPVCKNDFEIVLFFWRSPEILLQTNIFSCSLGELSMILFLHCWFWNSAPGHTMNVVVTSVTYFFYAG